MEKKALGDQTNILALSIKTWPRGGHRPIAPVTAHPSAEITISVLQMLRISAFKNSTFIAVIFSRRVDTSSIISCIIQKESRSTLAPNIFVQDSNRVLTPLQTECLPDKLMKPCHSLNSGSQYPTVDCKGRHRPHPDLLSFIFIR